MLAYFPQYDKVVNTEAITYVGITDYSDRYDGPHVIVRFIDGDFMEFPPGVSLHEVFTTLTERSSDG